MKPLVALLYTSRARDGLDESEVIAILASANRHNVERDLTGALLFYAGRFMQIVEGAPAEVEACFARICDDPRHDDIQLLFKREVLERRFGRWAMRHVRVAHGADRAVNAFFAELIRKPTDPLIEQAIALLSGLTGSGA